MSKELSWDEFDRVDMRVGTVVACEVNKKAIKPSFVLDIDLGPLGIRRSSAQITDKYDPESVVGLQVIAVVNFPPKQIASVISECLVLGVMEEGGVTLIQPGNRVQNGTRIG